MLWHLGVVRTGARAIVPDASTPAHDARVNVGWWVAKKAADATDMDEDTADLTEAVAQAVGATSGALAGAVIGAKLGSLGGPIGAIAGAGIGAV